MTIRSTLLALSTASILAAGLATAQAAEQPAGPPPVAGQAAGGFGSATLAAAILADGSHSPALGGIGVRSSQRFSTGTYEVIFQRPIQTGGCYWVGSISEKVAGVVGPGEIGLDGRAGNINGVFVQTFDSAGNVADKPFQVIVHCGF